MNTEKELVVYVENPELSEAVQLLAFQWGFSWTPRNEKTVARTEAPILLFRNWDEYGDAITCSYSRRDEEISATSEFGKIIEWFKNFHKSKKSELQDLRKEVAEKDAEITRLTQELSQYQQLDWHNPEGLSDDQIGVKDGWRLLLKSEVGVGKRLTRSTDIQLWKNRWSNYGYYGDDYFATYRVKWPIPSPINTPTKTPDTQQALDDFPTPDKQNNEVIRKYLTKQLENLG